MSGYELLANAVVKQAADDYTKALCITRGNITYPEDEQKRNKIQQTIYSCEKFFTGGGINLYTNLDGNTLMQMLQQEARDYNYDYKKLMKSRKR